MIAKEASIAVLASVILGAGFTFTGFSSPFTLNFFLLTSLFFFIIIALNITAKKLVAYYYEADTETKFWAWYQYGFKQGSHFKRPVPMFWFPPLLSLISSGFIQWLAILEFDVKPRVERAARRHGIYGFTEMEDYHIAVIAAAGIALNLIVAIISYFLAGAVPSLELFARLNIFFAFWSLIPLSSLDGTKILFGSKIIWFALLIISAIFLGYTFVVV